MLGNSFYSRDISLYKILNMTDICHAFHAILKICVDLPVSSKSTASASSFFSVSNIQNRIWVLGHVKQY